jgi:predicted TIM-barrel fold metal-dependent hydrolase
MGLIGSIVGGLASTVGGIFAGKAANKGYNQAISSYEDRMKQLQAHRDRLYYQDPTQTAENQAAVTQARELLNEQARNAAAVAAVAGGTDESIASQKAAAAKAVGNMMQQQAVQGAAGRERVWENADRQLTQMNNYIAQTKLNKGLSKAQAISQAAGGLAGAANGLDFGTLKLKNGKLLDL